MISIFAKRTFTLKIERYSATKYIAKIHQHQDGDSFLAWHAIKRLRGEVKAIADIALADLKALAESSHAQTLNGLRPYVSSTQVRKRGVPKGMFGFTQSDEARAKIGASVAKRHAEGAYRKAKLGRLTKAEKAERDTERAAAAGLTLAQYRARQLYVKKQLDREREIVRSQRAQVQRSNQG